MSWNNTAFDYMIDKTVGNALDGDLSLFQPREMPVYRRSEINKSESSYKFEGSPYKVPLNENVRIALRKAVQSNGTSLSLQILRAATKQAFPALFEIQKEVLS